MNDKERVEFAKQKLRTNSICQIYDRITEKKKESKTDNFKMLKTILDKEKVAQQGIEDYEKNLQNITIIPITHNEDMIMLQMCGWSINLCKDGTWYWEDTTGG